MTKILKTYEELKANVGNKVKVKRVLTNEIFEGILSSTVCDNVDYIEIIVETKYYGLTDQNYKIYSIWQSIELIEEDNNNKENMTKFVDTTDYKACEEANREEHDSDMIKINQDMKEQQILITAIICTAVRFNDIIIPCIHHLDKNCLKIIKLLNLNLEDVDCGFLDTNGKFYNRREASDLIKTYDKDFKDSLLTSEQLIDILLK